ncbi:MAG: thymidine kinase [Cyclobacteriaceae bacterium]|nr:thymidine kinase [Cyclobacteriaceae bacterium]
MFLEPHINNRVERKAGWIEVICGSMFSGKTEELIRRLNRALIAEQHVEIFKPSIDKRYHDTNVVSHNSSTIRSTPVDFANDILLKAGNCDVVGIDEAQFFDNSLIEVCEKLSAAGKRVVIAGLDMDFEAKPFEPVPFLMSIAEYVTKVHAICATCGNIASFSFRLSTETEKVKLGEKDLYQARCRTCYQEGMKQREND